MRYDDTEVIVMEIQKLIRVGSFKEAAQLSGQLKIMLEEKLTGEAKEPNCLCYECLHGRPHKG